jgi:predicted MFS family arabinose efflux permease
LRVFYAAYLILPMLAAGTLPATWTRAVVGWFSTGRGLALGLSLVATGMIGAALPAYLTWLIGIGGWRAGYLGLALIPLLIGLPPAIAFFRDPPQGATLPPTDVGFPAMVGDYGFGDAIRTRSFWQMSISFVLAAICVSAVLTHAIPLLLDRGIAATVAAGLAGLFGLAVTGGRLLSGYLLDSCSGPLLASLVFLAAAVACVLLVVCGDNRLLCGSSIVLVGLAAGGEADIGAYLTTRYFGRSHYGAIYGLFYAIYCLGGGLGPFIAGLVHDRTGSYRSALRFCGSGGSCRHTQGTARVGDWHREDCYEKLSS